MFTVRRALLGFAGAALVLTGCSDFGGMGPSDVETVEIVDDAVEGTLSPNDPQQETLRPSSPAHDEQDSQEELQTDGSNAGFQEVKLEIFTGEPLPDAVPGDCETGVASRCFADDGMVYDKCLADPYGSGQYACPVASLEDLVVLEAGAPSFEPSINYSDYSGRALGFAEVQAQDSGEIMFCSPRTGGTGFEGPEAFPLWLGMCSSVTVSNDDTYIYWMGAMREQNELGYYPDDGYWVDEHAEAPEVAYVIHGPGYDPDELHFADIRIWYY